MCVMESYYSSDEEIAWGPITLREIKGDLKRPRRRPNRRHTAVCNIQSIKKEVVNYEPPAEDMNKLNISGTSTAYFTPEETVANVSTSDLSKYASVIEDPTNSTNRSEHLESPRQPGAVPDIIVSETSPPSESCINFIEGLKNRGTEYDIEKFQQTLVENTLILTEDEAYSDEEHRQNGDHFHEEASSVTEEEDEAVIIISDDSDSCIINDDEQSDYKSITSFKKEMDCKEIVSLREGIDFNLSKDRYTEEDETEYKNQNQVIVNSGTGIERFSDICNDPESSDEDNQDDFLIMPNMQHNLSTIRESLSTSPVIVPEIDLKQFDESIPKDDSLHVNDMWEEMNRLQINPNMHHKFSTIKDSSRTSPDIAPDTDLIQLHESISKDESLQFKATLEKMNRIQITPNKQNKFSMIKESLSSSPVTVPENDVIQFDGSISKDESFHFTTLEEMNRIQITPSKQHKLSTIQESLSSSQGAVPKSDLIQFDESISKDDSLHLNDTLEEMNRLLSQGLNYSMSDDEVIENTPIKKAPSPQTQCYSSSSSHGKDLRSHIPRGIVAHSAKKTLTKCMVTKSSPQANFKVPVTPLRPKLIPPTPPHLKNVVSPVALYIKNSPRFPLKKNVPLKEDINIAVTPVKLTKADKENWPEFPEVVYRPSKKQLVSSTERHIVVPSYMKKLNIKEGHITKHEGRIQQGLDKSKVSKLLQEADITSTSINQSLFDNTGDISVLTKNQAFIK